MKLTCPKNQCHIMRRLKNWKHKYLPATGYIYTFGLVKLYKSERDKQQTTSSFWGQEQLQEQEQVKGWEVSFWHHVTFCFKHPKTKSNSNIKCGLQIIGFCLVVEITRVGFIINRNAPVSFQIDSTKATQILSWCSNQS